MVYRDRDPVRQVTLLDVQWSNLDEEIVEEVRNLWRLEGLPNDSSYLTWRVAEEIEKDKDWVEAGRPGGACPKLNEYLKSRDIEECLIHYWW